MPIRHPARPVRDLLVAALAALSVALSSCGSDSQDLSRCGNGRIDSGEQCDDGNQADGDACTAVCRQSRCGDGAIETGVEQCDGTNIPIAATCDTFGLALGDGGRRFPGCTGACAFDLSLCGPPIPTATPSASPTITPSPSPTPTLPATTCGDGLLERGETCESCPVDCTAAACEPGGADVTFAIAMRGSRQPTQARVLLAYRSSVIAIPGTGADTSVRQRVRPAPPLPQSFVVADLDYAVDITSSLASGLPSPFATARFQTCAGAPAATVGDLTCFVQSCTDSAGAIPNCACDVTPR